VKFGLTFRGEYSMRMFKNRVPRKMFRPQREEISGDGKRLLNDDFNLSCLPILFG
jgi:hypothetical protein